MKTDKISSSIDKKSRTLLPLGCGKLGTDNTEMVPLGHFRKCKYWWNGGHSPSPHHGEILKSLLEFNVKALKMCVV